MVLQRHQGSLFDLSGVLDVGGGVDPDLGGQCLAVSPEEGFEHGVVVSPSVVGNDVFGPVEIGDEPLQGFGDVVGLDTVIGQHLVADAGEFFQLFADVRAFRLVDQITVEGNRLRCPPIPEQRSNFCDSIHVRIDSLVQVDVDPFEIDAENQW